MTQIHFLDKQAKKCRVFVGSEVIIKSLFVADYILNYKFQIHEKESDFITILFVCDVVIGSGNGSGRYANE
jgi:hypothetical protein